MTPPIHHFVIAVFLDLTGAKLDSHNVLQACSNLKLNAVPLFVSLDTSIAQLKRSQRRFTIVRPIP